jgi:hypothetical protein
MTSVNEHNSFYEEDVFVASLLVQEISRHENEFLVNLTAVLSEKVTCMNKYINNRTKISINVLNMSITKLFTDFTDSKELNPWTTDTC